MTEIGQEFEVGLLHMLCMENGPFGARLGKSHFAISQNSAIRCDHPYL